MQVELVGCTGAGKSSLLNRILHLHAGSPSAVSGSNEFMLRRTRLDWLTGSARLMAVNIISLGMCALAWRKRRPFLRYVISCIGQLRQHVSFSQRMRILRITLRNVGLYEFVERYASDEEVVFTDEGMLQIAHYLFVHTAFEPRLDQVETFARLAPMPAAVLYLRQPEALLIERTLQRGHKRIPPDSIALTTRFVSRAARTFEWLIQQPAVRTRLLVVDAAQQPASITQGSDTDPSLHRLNDLIRAALPPAQHSGNTSARYKQA